MDDMAKVMAAIKNSEVQIANSIARGDFQFLPLKLYVLTYNSDCLVRKGGKDIKINKENDIDIMAVNAEQALKKARIELRKIKTLTNLKIKSGD